MPKMGLVLQGGGALGAYEYGAVTRLIELGWCPTAVTGVSIGAATAAAVAGARGGDICKSLKSLWDAITLDPVPFWPPEHQATFSIFGNPRFWRPRQDVFNFHRWTGLSDVSPMRETLAQVCDFDQINDCNSHQRADRQSGLFRKLRWQYRLCRLRDAKNISGAAYSGSHSGKR
jgi:NTE family protein